MEDTLTNIIDARTKVKVSSVYSNNTVQNGKQNMFDENEDTSWYSDQGKIQYVFLCFDDATNINKIEVTGSGGFCPKVFLIINFYELEILYSDKNEYSNKKPQLNSHTTYFLDDTNSKQTINIDIENCKTLKLMIKSFYDLYGRVIIYDLKIFGKARID